MEAAELWIRLENGRSICERYNQLEMAEFMRQAMIDSVDRGEALLCFDGEQMEIPAKHVRRIELLLAHESRRNL